MRYLGILTGIAVSLFLGATSRAAQEWGFCQWGDETAGRFVCRGYSFTVEEFRDMCGGDDANRRKSCVDFMRHFAEHREFLAELEHLRAHKHPEGNLCPPMTTKAGRWSFLLWSDRHREQWQENWMEGLTQAWNSNFPCAKP
jgi:hypothetical protein